MRTRADRLRVAVLTLAALFSIVPVGCSAAETSGGEVPQWDPCSAFPDSAMQQLGLNYKSSVQTPGKQCAWLNTKTDYGTEVQYSTSEHTDDWRAGIDTPIDTTIGQYTGYRYRSLYQDRSVDPNFICTVRLKTKNSYVVFKVINQMLREEDSCAVATDVATALVNYLPPPG